MATVSDKSQQGYAEPDEFIQYQLEQARSRIKATDLLTASVLAGLLLIGYVFTFTILDHWVINGGFGPWTRAGMLIVVVLLCSAILIRYVAVPWFRRIHPLYAARMLDRSSQGLEGSLLALIDLQSGGRKNDTPIQKSLEKRAAVKLAEVHVDEAIDRRMLIRLGTALFVITLLTCLYAVFSPKAISLLRPLTLAAANVSTRTVVETVLPGDKRVPAGTRVEFVADIAGVIPEDVQVLYTTADKRYVDEPLQMRATEDEHRFQVLMSGDGDRGVRQDIRYRIVAGDASSEEYLISVNQPPTAQVNEVRYVYPAYMQLPDRIDTSGAIDAWEGSVVTINAQSSVPIKTATLQLSDDAAFTAHGEEVAMTIKGTALTGELKLDVRADQTVPKFYRIAVTDEEGNSDPEPVVYPLEIRRDQPPIVKLLDPNRDLQVPANAIVPLLVEAEDPDFLLRSVTLNYSINGKQVQPSEVLLDTSGIPLPKKWSDTWEFRLSTLKLNPGDVVTYHVQARDNRPPLGNQGRSGDLNLQITAPVTDEEVQKQLAQDHELQQQLKDRQNPDVPPTNSGTNPEEMQFAETPPTEGTTPEEVPTEPETDPAQPKNEQPNAIPQGSSSPAEQKSGTAKNSGERKATEQNPNSQSQPGKSSSPAQPTRRRADDEAALQRLIEEMNRKRQENPGESGEDTTESRPGKMAEAEAEKESGETPTNNTEPQPKPSDSETPPDNSRAKPEAASEKPQPKSQGTPESTEPSDSEMKSDVGESEPNSKSSNEEPAENSTTPEKPETSQAAEENSSMNEPSKAEAESKPGESKPGEGKTGESKPGESKPGEGKPGEGKPGEGKPGEGKPGEGKPGDGKPGDGKPGEGKPGEGKPGEGKPGEGKPGEGKPGEGKPGDGKPGEGKPGEGKPGEGKPGEGKPGEGKPGEGKPGEGKPGEGKPGEGKPGEGKPGEGKPGEGKPGEGKPGEGKPGEGKPGEGKPGEGKPGEGKPGEGKPGEGKPGEGKPGEGKPGEGKPGEGKPGEGKPGEGKPGEGKPGEGKPGEGKPGEGKPGEGKPGEGKPGEGKPGEGMPGEGKPREGKPGEGKPGEGKPGEGKPGEGKPGEGKPGEGKPGEGKPGEGKPGEGKPGEGKPGEGKPGEGKPGEGKPGEGKPGEGKPGEGKPGEGKPGEGKPGEGKPGEGKPGEGKPGEGKPSDGQPGSGTPGVAKPGKEQSAAGTPGGPSTDNIGNSKGTAGVRGGDDKPAEQSNEASDPAVEEAADAADLALKRLDKELDRGEIDPKLLEELGWTENELRDFHERLQKQLAERKLTAQQQREKDLAQKSFDEMLRSLDVKSTGNTRQGRTDKDRDQQDTTGRQSAVPKQLEEKFRMYQRSMSGQKGAKSQK